MHTLTVHRTVYRPERNGPLGIARFLRVIFFTNRAREKPRSSRLVRDRVCSHSSSAKIR